MKAELKEVIINLIWEFENGHITPYELVQKIKELETIKNK